MTIVILGMCTLTFILSLKNLSNNALAVLFVIMGISAAGPFYLIPLFDGEQLLPGKLGFFLNYLGGGIAYLIGAAVLATRVPERFFHVKFDLLGASHNIWHVAVLTGCFWHLITAFRMYNERQNFVCPISIPAKFDKGFN